MKNVDWNAPRIPLTGQPAASRLGVGGKEAVLNVVRTARHLQEQINQPLLREHDLQVMWLAYRLACTAEVIDTPPHNALGTLTCEQVLWAGLLHDVGKHAIPDAILTKPEPLTANERLVMQAHPMHGHQMAAQLAQEHHLPEIDGTVLQGILHHHERYDGEGYPGGLSGEGIPLLARILTVVDVYAALTSHRHYRPAWSSHDALGYLLAHQGTIFDPRLVQHAVSIFQYH